MSETKVKKLIRQFKQIQTPKSPKNTELDKIWGDLMQDISDYVGWEKSYMDDTLNKAEVFLDEALNKRLEKFKPKTNDDKKSWKEITRFKEKMDEIIREIMK